MIEKCDVILVFVNDNEKKAVCDALKERHARDPVVKFGEVLTYHDFGIIGGAKVLGLQIEMGSTTPAGAAVSIFDALNEKNPQYVILVGIAFGMDREKQRIGDILVSQKLSQYEAEKISTSKDGELIDIPRGDIYSIEQPILGRFRALSAPPYRQGGPVHFGLMVSGDKLIDFHETCKEKVRRKAAELLWNDRQEALKHGLQPPEQVNYHGEYPYAGGEKGKYRGETVEVKSLPCNNWGLYQMHGNVWEWCSDWYGDYPTGSVIDPVGPSSGTGRVLRGGGWIGDGGDARSAYRLPFDPAYRFNNPGFRLARGQKEAG